MFSLSGMPSTASVLSTYTTFAASAMLVRTVVSEVETMANQLIPQQLREKIVSKLGGLLGSHSSEMVLVIQEFNGLSVNQIYQASELYLRTKITPSVGRLNVSKGLREKNLSVTVSKGEMVVDVFEGIELRWQLICAETQKPSFDYDSGSMATEKSEQRSIELIFHKKYKEVVLSTYLPYVIERSRAIKEENKVVKLCSLGNFSEDYDGPWGSINLSHPCTFDTLAMDPTLKKELIADLDRFVRRREFYQKVGKAWKRGYLLYGPPGTGKSSLIAAMANYLKFNIYDLELTSLWNNSDLRRLLVSTANRSILVIEDIDCSVELQNRQNGSDNNTDSQLTLSGLLNFIDGLWSSCGDERIIVFTTNHKERLDPALLRPGRMDMHIHMSYCTPSGFKILAANYLNINTHPLFTKIERLMTEVEVTPAEIAEELLKCEEVDVALEGIIKFLERKKMQVEHDEKSNEGVKEVDEQEVSNGIKGDKMGVKRNKMKKTRRAKGRH
ncbi:hypothetical protein AAG906_004188 [Vitis piasezkii]|uniref:AAA+ ATPase domain-containing protein n=1 Tax=Vitis vinifera TaxID=29760 RepID=A0ABY9BFH9_VITVI|nr:AAA-ATPase At3g50940 [Vitis vinifera]WJZ81573.1 hypothetical protein VitviT2T_001411 [Vitis vinifera]|eukprot:XP_010655379.1 PREDICTED: AAA-ATPase At3g50940 [Vitis vinifera]